MTRKTLYPGKTELESAKQKIAEVQANYVPPEPPAEPTNELDYPIEAIIGEIPESGVFDDFNVEQQVALSAARTFHDSNYFNEQELDWAIIRDQNPASGYPSNIWQTAANDNQKYIAYWVKGVGGNTALVKQSWQYYMNWILGVDDGASHVTYGGWDGTRDSFLSYKGWYVHKKKLSVTAIPHNGW